MLDVGRVMKRARKLLRRRVLRPIDLAIVDCLVFSCSHRGQDRACASYNSLARLIGAGRDAVIAGIKRLVAAGLIAKHKQSRLVQWRLAGRLGARCRTPTASWRRAELRVGFPDRP